MNLKPINKKKKSIEIDIIDNLKLTYKLVKYLKLLTLLIIYDLNIFYLNSSPVPCGPSALVL